MAVDGTQEDSRFRNPVSATELNRRWTAVRERMRDAKIDALIVQGAANFVGGGGYLRWMIGTCGGGTYGTSAILPREGLLTLIHHGALGTESNPEGRDKTAPGIGRWGRVGAPNFPAVHYTTSIDAEVVAREVKKSGYRTIGLVAPFTMYHGFASKLEKELSGLTVVDATELIDPIKADKSAEEVTLIRNAARMQDDLVEKIRGYIKPGMKDYEVMAYSDYLRPGRRERVRVISSALRRRRASRQAFASSRSMVARSAMATSSSGRPRTKWPRRLFRPYIARYFVFGKAPQELVDGFAACVGKHSSLRWTCSSPACPAPRPLKAYNAYLKGKGLGEEGGGFTATARAMTSSSGRC